MYKRDLAAIAELEATAFGPNRLTRNALDVIYDPSGGLWVLIEDDAGVWGHSVSARGEDPSVGWILGLAVHPDRQKRGWGRILLQASIDRLRDNDINVVRLLVKATNKASRHLYEGFGFIVTAERADHFGPGEHRLEMSLLLSPDEPEPAPTPEGVGVPPMPQVPADPDAGFVQIRYS